MGKTLKVCGTIALVITRDRIIAKSPRWAVKAAARWLPEPVNGEAS